MSIKYYTNWWQYSWRLDCKLLYWSEQLSRWMSDESWCSEMDVHEWQLCHVRRLALHFHIFFYSMQHMPLWRSKFRMRIKTIRTKKGTLRISHTSSKLPQDIRSGSFDHKDQLLEENRSYKWQGLVTRAYRCSPEISDVLLLFVSVSC